MAKSERKKRYETNKKAKVGTEITCAVCGTKFIKKQWQQAFCCSDCKNAYWNAKKDRHRDPNYYHNYNIRHPERLERIGIYKDDITGDLGYYDDEGYFRTFREDAECAAMCENPILGI